MGFKENVTLQQVRNVLEGESHEEKIQEIIARVSWQGNRHQSLRAKFTHGAMREGWCRARLIMETSPTYRTKKLKPKKNSNDEPNNSRCKDENNNERRLRARR